MALSLPRLRRPSPVPHHGGASVHPGTALLHEVTLRRRHWRTWIVVEAVLLGVEGFLALGALVAALVMGSGVAGRLGPRLLAVAALIAVSVATWNAWRRLWRSRDLARWSADQTWLADRRMDRAEQLRTGIEIAGRAQLPNAAPLGSPLLVVRAIAQAAGLMPVLDTARQQLRRRVAQWALLVAVTLLGWVWSAVATPALWRHLWQPAQVEKIREVGTLVVDPAAHVEPPAYARAVVEPRDEEGSEVEVLRGSHVAVAALPVPSFSVKFVEVETQVGGGTRLETLPTTWRKDGRLTWGHTVLESLKYRYRGVDQDGLPVREAGYRTLKTRSDQVPVTQITNPAGEIEVKSGQIVPIDGNASDDIGLAVVHLVVARPAAGDERRPIAVSPGALNAEIHEQIVVDQLQLRPGEVAVVQLEAADDDPLDGERRGASQKVRIRMFSPERQHARNLEELARLTTLWTLRLADRLEKDPALGQVALPVALKTRGEMAVEEQRGLDALEALRREWTDDVVGRGRTSADLLEIEQHLRETLGDESRSVEHADSEATGYAAVQAMAGLQRQHAMVIAAEEQAVHALGAAAVIEHQNALSRDGANLAETEKQLVQALEKLADSQGAASQAEAERLLDQVEQQLQRMAEAAQAQMHVVPQEHMNAGAEPSGLQRDLGEHRSALEDIRKLLREGKTREALDRMRQMQQQMAETMQDMSDSVSGERSAEEREMQKLAGDLRRGISRAQEGEERLRDDVRPLAEEQDRATAEHLRGVRATLMPQVIDLLEEARDQIQPQRMATAESRGSRNVAEARQALQTAAGGLERGQIDAALQALMEAEDELGTARRELAEDPDVSEKSRKTDDGRLAAAQERAQKASARLREALPSPQAMLKPGGRQRLEGGAQEQEQLRRSLEKLKKTLEENAQTHPALQRQVGDRLEHAEETMRQAMESLQQSDASRALRQSSEALDALRRAATALDEAQSGGKPRKKSSDGVGMNSPEAPVTLQADERGEGGEQYRQDVLRAMQQKAPATWAERLQKYYKAIAR